MTELQGEEYAGERALVNKNRADVADIRCLFECAGKVTDPAEKGYYRTVLDLIGTKNPEAKEEIGRDIEVTRRWIDILQPDLSERDKKNLFIYVQADGMTPEFDASQMNNL